MSKSLNQIKSYARQKNLPLIPVRADDISIISEPKQFYSTLLDFIKLSKKRIALSALYLGTGPKERALIQAICDNINSNSCLNVDLVLDANRASRQDIDGSSSLTVLNQLLEAKSVNLNLVETKPPGSFMGQLLHRTQKLNEISSTYHTKVLLFDDDVLITGANLSNIYFEQRQDRYMLMKNSKLLSDYLHSMLKQLSHEQDSIKSSIGALNQEFNHRLASDQVGQDSDSYIIPLTQCKPSSITEKEDFLEYLNSILPSNAKVHLSTGYFNPSEVVDNLRVSSVVAPSEQANGFYGARGLLQFVPRIYSALYKQYMDNHPKCKLFLYDKPGWTYHGKGIWVEGMDDLYVHLIGSSNFNCRSSGRDFETQLVLLTSNKNLIKLLHDERMSLWKEAEQAREKSFEGLNLIYHTVARLLKTFL